MKFLHLDFENEPLHNLINSFVRSPILVKNVGPNFFQAPLP